VELSLLQGAPPWWPGGDSTKGPGASDRSGSVAGRPAILVREGGDVDGYAAWLADFQRRQSLHDRGVQALARDLAPRTGGLVPAAAGGGRPSPGRHVRPGRLLRAAVPGGGAARDPRPPGHGAAPAPALRRLRRAPGADRGLRPARAEHPRGPAAAGPRRPADA